MSELKLNRSLFALFFVVVAGLNSCSSTPPEQPEAPKEETRRPALPRFEGRRSQIAPLPEFQNTAAAAPVPEPVKAEAPPLWIRLAHLDRGSTPFALLFAGLLWALMSLLSMFYRYNHARDGFVARSLVSLLIAVPFTLYWITGSVVALGVIAVMALTLAIATFTGWRRERRWRRTREDSVAPVEPTGVSPGLTRGPAPSRSSERVSDPGRIRR